MRHVDGKTAAEVGAETPGQLTKWAQALKKKQEEEAAKRAAEMAEAQKNAAAAGDDDWDDWDEEADDIDDLVCHCHQPLIRVQTSSIR